jgi:hypothetical protein
MKNMKYSPQNRNINIKRKSEFQKTNRIRLDLFSFAKNEINEQNKQTSSCFSFANKLDKEKNENSEKELKKEENKLIIKAISLNSKKTTNDSSSNMSDSEEEESSEISCEEEVEL